MLDQRRVLVVKYEFFQGAVQVVRLGEAETRGGLVDDAVLHLTVHAATRGENRHSLALVLL